MKDLIGLVFGRIEVLSYSRTDGRRQKYWSCKCRCGEVKEIRGASLLNGSTKSCGCLKREFTIKRNFRHGLRGHPLYPTWNNMMHRCRNENSGEWHNYGGRGILVCRRWEKFSNFAEDMGPKPSDNHSIDRINVNGNYEPKNCRWASNSDQNNNKRSSRNLTFKGKTQTVAQWSKELGINHERIRSRVKTKMPDADCLFPGKHKSGGNDRISKR